MIDEPRRVRWGYVAAASVCFIICSNGPSTYATLYLVEGVGGWTSWPYAYPFNAVALAGGLLLAIALVRTPPRTWPWPLAGVAMFSAWQLASVLWSVAPDSTRQLSMTAVGIAAFGVWFGWWLQFAEQVWSIAVATQLLIVASVAVVIVRPEYGKMYDGWLLPDPPWQGIFGNRNSLAPVCVLGLLSLAGVLARHRTALAAAAATPFALLDLVALTKSGGSTALITLGLVGVTALAVPVTWALRERRVRGVYVASAGVAIVALAWPITFSVLSRLERRAERGAFLNGRRLIWSDVRGFIREEPLHGYGWWAFWDRPDLVAETYDRLGGPYASAHNSVLEVLLGLGVVGLILYLAIGFTAVAGIARAAWERRSAAVWWWALVLVFVLAQNLTESFVLWNSYMWVLFLAAAVVPFAPATQTERARAVVACRQVACEVEPGQVARVRAADERDDFTSV